MELNPNQFDQVLLDFHKSWNLDRIKQMTIQEYADLANHDSLCYWLEYGSKPLGAIGNIHLQKFELWKPKEIKEFEDNRFLQAEGYAWNRTKGATLNEAFENISALIVKIVQFSQLGDWAAIDGIPFHSIGKWKIAMLFSEKRVLPVYSRDALEAIAMGLGVGVEKNTPISVLQKSILAFKDAEEDIAEFSHRLYVKYASVKSIKPSYFIIGSFYENQRSVMSDFLAQNVVAMNWMNWVDFSLYMGKKKNEVNAFLDKNFQLNDPHLTDAKRYFWLFSKIKAGDIIAIKSKGAFNDLTIIAYALVVNRNGATYKYDANGLGHMINVEFLDAGFVRKTHQNYAKTIHKLDFQLDPSSAFQKIFGWYANLSTNTITTTSGELPNSEDSEDNDHDLNGDYRDKNETPFWRTPVASVIVNQVHNRLQNKFVRYLQSVYPTDNSTGEKKYIDVVRFNEAALYLYEIKPDNNAKTCIRLGLGQLLDYAHRRETTKNKHLFIVGPNDPDGEALQFIAQLRDWLTIPFSYIAFDETALIAKEFPIPSEITKES
ncbi:MAG: hypothetical protein EOO07_01020 [Chitinophagaceae bacterium]|nr:MAG: hypothetical protein EOO07_01020 [Chitinophagaceae bacterium]